MLEDFPILQTLVENPLFQVVAPITIVGGLAALIGFVCARWLYRQEALMRVSVLQYEVIRLRRKVSEQESVAASGQRSQQRLKRRLRARNNDE